MCNLALQGNQYTGIAAFLQLVHNSKRPDLERKCIDGVQTLSFALTLTLTHFIIHPLTHSITHSLILSLLHSMVCTICGVLCNFFDAATVPSPKQPIDAHIAAHSMHVKPSSQENATSALFQGLTS